MARTLGTARVAQRETMDLTDEEFAAVTSAGTPPDVYAGIDQPNRAAVAGQNKQ